MVGIIHLSKRAGLNPELGEQPSWVSLLPPLILPLQFHALVKKFYIFRNLDSPFSNSKCGYEHLCYHALFAFVLSVGPKAQK